VPAGRVAAVCAGRTASSSPGPATPRVVRPAGISGSDIPFFIRRSFLSRPAVGLGHPSSSWCVWVSFPLARSLAIVIGDRMPYNLSGLTVPVRVAFKSSCRFLLFPLCFPPSKLLSTSFAWASANPRCTFCVFFRSFCSFPARFRVSFLAPGCILSAYFYFVYDPTSGVPLVFLDPCWVRPSPWLNLLGYSCPVFRRCFQRRPLPSVAPSGLFFALLLNPLAIRLNLRLSCRLPAGVRLHRLPRGADRDIFRLRVQYDRGAAPFSTV